MVHASPPKKYGGLQVKHLRKPERAPMEMFCLADPAGVPLRFSAGTTDTNAFAAAPNERLAGSHPAKCSVFVSLPISQAGALATHKTCDLIAS